MREIKFRAWDNIYKKMLNWIPDICESMMTDFINDPTDQFVIMQYTGLKDKNGKEIYEGDKDEEYGIVVFDDEYLGFFCRPYFPHRDNEKPLYDCSLLEVIGNIYENPELLE